MMTKPKTGVDVLREALRVGALSDIDVTWESALRL